RPALGVDGGDPAHPVEVEGAAARQTVRDGGGMPVGAVGVGTVVDDASPGGDVLRGEPSGLVPGRGDGDRVAEDAGEFPAGGVVGECDAVPAAGQAVGLSVGAVGVGSDVTGGGGAARAAAQGVVGVGDGAAVHQFGLDLPPAVVLVAEFAVRSGRLQQAARPVVGVGRHPAVDVLADHLAELVTLEGDGPAERVGAGGEPARGVHPVGEYAVVEVGLGDDVACGVVLVGPGQALRVDDAGETQFGIVLERVAGAVGPGATDQEVEVGVLEAGDTTGRIRVGENVALAVVGPRLRGSIGAYASGELPVGVPFQAGDAAHRVGDADRPAEGVPSRARAGAAGTGHLHGQPRRVAHHARHGSECVRDRGEATGVVVGVAGGGGGLVGDRRAVSPLVELMDHTGAVRPDDLHRQTEPAANGPQLASVGAGGGDDPAVLVVEERGGVSQRVGAGEQVAVGVVGEAGGVAERVGGGDHPAAVVDQVAGRVSGGGGEGGGAVAGVRVGVGVGQGDLDVAGFAAFCDDAVAVVVDVVVAAAVGVDPGGDAPAVVVDERGGRAGGFGDGGEVAVLVVAVGHEWQVGAVLAPAGQ